MVRCVVGHCALLDTDGALWGGDHQQSHGQRNHGQAGGGLAEGGARSEVGWRRVHRPSLWVNTSSRLAITACSASTIVSNLPALWFLPLCCAIANHLPACLSQYTPRMPELRLLRAAPLRCSMFCLLVAQDQLVTARYYLGGCAWSWRGWSAQGWSLADGHGRCRLSWPISHPITIDSVARTAAAMMTASVSPSTMLPYL